MKQKFNFYKPNTILDWIMGFVVLWTFCLTFLVPLFENRGFIISLIEELNPILLVFVLVNLIVPSAEGLGQVGIVFLFSFFILIFLMIMVPILNKLFFNKFSFFVPFLIIVLGLIVWVLSELGIF